MSLSILGAWGYVHPSVDSLKPNPSNRGLAFISHISILFKGLQHIQCEISL